MNTIVFILSIIVIVYMFKLLINRIINNEVEITLDFNKINLNSFNEDLTKLISSFKHVNVDNKVFNVVQNDYYRVSVYKDVSKKDIYYVNCLKSRSTYRGTLEEIKKSILKKEEDINIIKHIICASISLKFK